VRVVVEALDAVANVGALEAVEVLRVFKGVLALVDAGSERCFTGSSVTRVKSEAMEVLRASESALVDTGLFFELLAFLGTS